MHACIRAFFIRLRRIPQACPWRYIEMLDKTPKNKVFKWTVIRKCQPIT